MKGKTIAQRYEAMSTPPKTVTVEGECKDILESFKVPSTVFPSFDNVSTFFKKANSALPNMDQKAMSCVNREIAAISRATKDQYAKKVVANGRRDTSKRMETILNKANRKGGTTLKIGTPRKFEEFR